MSTPLVLRAVAKTLAHTPVLRDVSFTCPAGSITALLGPNGAGKTTAVSLATGLRRADSGRVEVFGLDPRRAEARHEFGLVPQDITFPDSVGVAVCLDLVERQRAPSPLIESRAVLCEAFGLGALLHRRVGGLSGGQKRRLAIVLGLIRAPGLLVLDEATSNLDDAGRGTTWRLVRDYADAGGTVLVTTHLLADIDDHADRVVALAAGRVVFEGPLADARARLGGTTEVSVRLPPARVTAVVAALTARFDRHCVLVGSGPTGSATVATRPPETPHSSNLGTAAAATPDSTRTTTVRWHTSSPLALVGALAHVAPDAEALLVRPVPLRRVLDSLAGDGPA